MRHTGHITGDAMLDAALVVECDSFDIPCSQERQVYLCGLLWVDM